MKLTLSRVTAACLRLALGSALIATTVDVSAAGQFTVSVARRDLRPLPNVALQVTGAVNRQDVTDANGRTEFPDLPRAGGVTITPLRSGFRFKPNQFTIPDLANPSAVAFVAYPTATDLAISITSDDPSPLVGGLVNSVITLRNLGAEAATDVSVGFSLLPGIELENAETTQGQLEFQTYGTLWTMPQLDPGASAKVQTRSRATLPDANVLTLVRVAGMDQTDVAPLNNSAELITRPRAATARLSLAMTIDPAPAKVGETIPVQLTLRNEGPNDATQVVVRTYQPPGASLTVPANGLDNTTVVIPRLAPGAQVQLSGALRVRLSGTYTLIANVTYLEQQLAAGAAWPEARANFTVQPAFARISLLAFSDPPNPRVGENITVFYVARNDGPDTVTGLKLFTREDWRLDPSASGGNNATPPVPGPFAFGDVLPVGSYTYLPFHYTVKAAGDLTNYLTVEYQDQLIPNAEDHPELSLPIKTLPTDVGLSLDANPKEITARVGDPVTIDIPVHNDGPQPAHGILVDYQCPAVFSAERDEVIHADRLERPEVGGYVDVLQPNETVTVRKHLIAATPGFYTNEAKIALSIERPDLLQPIAAKNIRLHVLPAGTPPDLGISVNVDKPEVNVGERAIFIVTVTNRTAQPAFNIWVSETHAAAVDLAFETVRSYGPEGDDQSSTATERLIRRIEPGASFSMSRTVRVRKPLTIPYVAKITGVYGLADADVPPWFATTQVSGVQVTSDMAPVAVADRTNVKNGDLVNFVLKERNLSAHLASHAGFYGGVGSGFQMLHNDLGNYGYYFDWSRPKDLQDGAESLSEWTEIGSQEVGYSYFSAYAIAEGQLVMSAQLSQLDQLDGEPANDLTQVQVTSAPASARVSLRQWPLWPNAGVGEIVPFVTEIRNEGPDRVTGLALVETTSANLELSYNSSVTGVSGNVVTSFLDSYVRLPALEPGQNFIWQRTYSARSAGPASRRVQVAGFDQTALGALPDNEATVTIQPAQADLQLEFIPAPTVVQMGVPTLVGVRVRNLGPAVATRAKISVAADGATISPFGYGPRASLDILSYQTFQTQLLDGESATVGFYLTPFRDGGVALLVKVQQIDQIDPNPANNVLYLTLDAGAAPPTPPILRVRKVRTDFFDHTPIAEIEIDQAMLDRVAPATVFALEASSNLRDWEFLQYVGLLPLAPVTFTDHVAPGVKGRAYRLRR